MNCNIKIKYKNSEGEDVEYSLLTLTNIENEEDINLDLISDELTNLDDADLNNIIKNLNLIEADINQDESITYLSGDNLVPNMNLTTLLDKFESLKSSDLYTDLEGLINKLNEVGFTTDGINILFLNGNDIVLKINDKIGVRGALLKNRFIVLNSGTKIDENTLQDLYHELLHLYFTKINENSDNIKEIKKYAGLIYNAIKSTNKSKLEEFKDNVYQNGKVNLNEFIAYIISDPEYLELIPKGVFKVDNPREYLFNLFTSIDSRIGELGRRVESHVSGEQVWDGDIKKVKFELYRGKLLNVRNIDELEWYIIHYSEYVKWDSDKNAFYFDRDNYIPFVGEFTAEYDDVKPSHNIETIWSNFEKSTESYDTFNNTKRFDLNYSESIPVSTFNAWTLEEGDVILFPQITKIPSKDDDLMRGQIKYGDFTSKYFGYSQWLPIYRTYTNKKGELLIQCVKKFGDKVDKVTISYTDYINSCAEKNLEPKIRKFYGFLRGNPFDSESKTKEYKEKIKALRDRFDEELEKSPEESALSYIITGGTNTSTTSYYARGKQSFSLRLLEGNDNSLIIQDLVAGDIVRFKWFTKESNGSYKTHYAYAPVYRTYGTVVEVILKNHKNGEYFTKVVQGKNVMNAVFNKSTHTNLVDLHSEFIDDVDEYKSKLNDKKIHQPIWFYLPGATFDPKYANHQLRGDFKSAIDKKAVLDYRRERLKQLRLGDSVGVYWGGKNDKGNPITSNHIVIGKSGDVIYFLNKDRSKKGDPTTYVSSVDIKDVDPVYSSHIRKPVLVSMFYNNESDNELSDSLQREKNLIAETFNKYDRGETINEETDYTSLTDFYQIENVTNPNECFNLKRGDIIKYREGEKEYVGIISSNYSDLGMVEVAGYYNMKDGIQHTFRKIIDPSSIIYVGYCNNDENKYYDLNIFGHWNYESKHDEDLYKLNHSATVYNEEDARKEADRINKKSGTNWVDISEAIVVISKSKYDYTIEHNLKLEHINYDQYRVVLKSPQIQKLIDNGTLVDVTNLYKKENNLDDLYVLTQTRKGYKFIVPTIKDYVKNPYKVSQADIKKYINIGDYLKIKYKTNSGKTIYTKYLAVESYTDTGIKLVGQLYTLDGRVINQRWNIKYSDLNTDRYTITEWRTEGVGRINFRFDESSNPIPPKYYVESVNKFNKKVLLDRVINNINSIFKINDEPIITVITDSTVRDWVAGKNSEISPYVASKLTQSGAFIYNNKIYINTDHASISSPIHEVMHLVMGIMKQTSPEYYRALIDRITSIPGVLRKAQEAMAARSVIEAKEEAAVEAIAKTLQGVFTQDNFNVKNIISTQEFSSNFINAVKEGLGLSDLRENLSENTLNALTNTLSKMTLGQIVAEFNSILKLNPRDLFNSNMLNFAKGHREINNIISDMIKNGNLMEKC